MSQRDLPAMDSLICFEAAARLLNFRAAAQAVSLTPAALSQRIKQLEQQMETRLFERSTRSVQLTDSGRAMLPVARRCIEAGRECVRAARGKLGPAAVSITVGTRFELGMSWIVPVLGKLEASLPHMTLHTYFGSGPELLAKLRARQLDCAITSSRLADASLDSIKLHEERYVFVGAPALLSGRPLGRVEDAREHRLLDIDDTTPLLRYLSGAVGEGELRFGSARWLGLGAAIRVLALGGEGVAVLPEHMVRGDLESGALVCLLPEIVPHVDYFRLVFRTDDMLRPSYEALGERLRGHPIV